MGNAALSAARGKKKSPQIDLSKNAFVAPIVENSRGRFGFGLSRIWCSKVFTSLQISAILLNIVTQF